MSPSANEIFDELATMIVRASLRNCFVDAALSQHLARVVAMRNATENADDMVKELTAQYNRARQGQITSELLGYNRGSWSTIMNKGKLTQIIGSVFDAEFAPEHVPQSIMRW